MSEQADPPSGTAGGWVPVPDPTTLTTAAVERAADQWRRELDALRETIETRLAAMDKAVELHREFAADIRPQTERLINHLRELTKERFDLVDARFDERNHWIRGKFEVVEQQFTERDVRTEQAARASKDALDAALRAASELVAQQNQANGAAAAKAEAAFTKQIDQIGAIIQNLEKSLTDRITELKERIDRGEGGAAGVKDSRTDARAFTATIIAIVSVLVAVISVVAFAVK